MSSSLFPLEETSVSGEEPFVQKKLSPFDFLNSINDTKAQIMSEEDERYYAAFVVNKSLSYFRETVLIANEMNCKAHLDNKLQFDFLRLVVPKKKRFSKWDKSEVTDDLQLLIDVYGYDLDKAKSVIDMFPAEELAKLRQRMYRGGKRRLTP